MKIALKIILAAMLVCLPVGVSAQGVVTGPKNTLEFIGIWEKVYNPNFNYGEFATIRNQSGLNSFKISVKEFVARTNAISVQAKAGRYGGTYAHKDIAFEFAMWISPEFKVYIVKERLKAGSFRLLTCGSADFLCG